MTRQMKSLERAALAAHARGDTWDTFWDQYAAEVCATEPHDKRRFARLVRRLMALVVSGDTDKHPVAIALMWGNSPRQAENRIT